ncbi:uncharacterized protein [Argopecten irradians]|uniref:uncharacterized protein n=1 Tax=Argopecten irradians TaxID=31199 RepID=UPI0037136D74
MHGDEQQGSSLGPCERIDEVPEPGIPLDSKEPSWKKVQEIVKKARSGSATGPNRIPYTVFKNCPKILRHLLKLLKVIWRKGKIPSYWQKAEGCFVQKEDNSDDINQFLTISFLNIEVKIFFSVLGRRLTTYMTENQYIDASIQNGGIPGFSGCVENNSIVTQLIWEAKKGLIVIWVDLANVYGTIPHMLILPYSRALQKTDSKLLIGIHLRFT